MGTTKSELFTARHNELAKAAKVLAHPARVAILEYISKQDACICNDLVDVIGLSQPTISQHLNEIKKIDLLQGNFEGKNLCYCIDRKRWQELQESFQSFFNQITLNCY